MNAKNRLLSKALVASVIVVLTGCAATQTTLEHRTMEVSTKQSETVFLDPVSKAQKTIYISIKNTSDESIDITPQLKTALSNQGYRVVNQPNLAHYLLQANIRKVGKMSIAASQSTLGGGYGSALAGAGTGAALGALGGHSNTIIAGGVAGGLIGMAADSLVKAVNYTMITDVQISERVGKGVVHEQFNASLQNGTASATTQTLSKRSDYQRYSTRIVSTANKVNLSFAQARPALEQDLAKTLAGIF